MNTFGYVDNTIRLRSGCYLDLADPQPDQFTFADIAGALSKICRFGGQSERFYSVAEHSWWCATYSYKDRQNEDCLRAVLMHDATEAFLGGVAKPIKIMSPEYARIESQMERVIAKKFNLDFRQYKWAIQDIDQAIQVSERLALFSDDNVIWPDEDRARVLGVAQCWDPVQAEREFTTFARDLGIKTS